MAMNFGRHYFFSHVSDKLRPHTLAVAVRDLAIACSVICIEVVIIQLVIDAYDTRGVVHARNTKISDVFVASKYQVLA